MKHTELSKRHHNLLWENLKMRLELEIIAERPESKAAQRIINRYRRKIAARNEVLKALQN